jgi:predicted RNA-binding Zn-ribbon protein involved in translation (DUF1610 family)
MGTLNPKNKCSACSYTWYPRGKALSLRCPSCGSTDVEIVRLAAGGIGGVGIAIAALVVFAIFRNSDRVEVPSDPPKTEQAISIEQSPAAPVSAQPIQEAPAATSNDVRQEVTSQGTEAVEQAQNAPDVCADLAAKAKEECAQGECTEAIKQSAGCTSKSVPTNVVF